ncbi:MAG: 4Fe-4S binding protein [Turicibacter sp.]|nr:4Fe-4S binding protein [Turicibacter sp.]
MARKIVEINENRCIGCGICEAACKQKAIEIIDGKAKLVRSDYCEGLGACLPICPANAISFKEPTKKNIGECDSSPRVIPRNVVKGTQSSVESHLNQWPIQIRLVSPNAGFFLGSHLLIAADCCAYAYGNFHNDYMKNRITLIGCPKLDDEDYVAKLTTIFAENEITSLIVTHMDVPCCTNLVNAVKTALENSGKPVTWHVITFSTEGKVVY